MTDADLCRLLLVVADSIERQGQPESAGLIRQAARPRGMPAPTIRLSTPGTRSRIDAEETESSTAAQARLTRRPFKDVRRDRCSSEVCSGGPRYDALPWPCSRRCSSKDR
jgi:hypothetical protein